MIKATKRQLDILTQLAYYGYSNREIAQKLGIKEPTVKMHLSSLYKRMGVKNRVQLVEKARKNKMFNSSMNVYCLEERTPNDSDFLVFSVFSNEEYANAVKARYEEKYPYNEYQIEIYELDDKRFIYGEV